MGELPELPSDVVKRGRELIAGMSDKGLESRAQLVWRILACATNVVDAWKSAKLSPELDDVKCLSLLEEHIGELEQALEESGFR